MNGRREHARGGDARKPGAHNAEPKLIRPAEVSDGTDEPDAQDATGRRVRIQLVKRTRADSDRLAASSGSAMSSSNMNNNSS